MLIFANPHSAFTGVLFMVAIFTAIGFIIYMGLTRNSAVRPEFRDGFGSLAIFWVEKQGSP